MRRRPIRAARPVVVKDGEPAMFVDSSGLLGHESLETLKHYAKLTITDLKATHEKCHPREREDSAPL